MDLQVELKGFEEVKEALGELPGRIARKVLRKGVYAGAAFLRGEIRTAAPIRRDSGLRRAKGGPRAPGYLKRKIGARYRRKVSSATEVHYMVGPIGYAFYGWFVEAGHKGGKSGWVDPHPFMVPRFEANVGLVTEKTKQALMDGIMKEGEALGFKKSYGWSF